MMERRESQEMSSLSEEFVLSTRSEPLSVDGIDDRDGIASKTALGSCAGHRPGEVGYVEILFSVLMANRRPVTHGAAA